MIHDGARLIENRIPAFPCSITEFDVFPVERREQRFETSNVEKLLPIKHRGAAAGKHRVKRVAMIEIRSHGNVALVNPNEPTRKASDFSSPAFVSGVQIKHAAVRGEYRPVFEVLDQRRDRIERRLRIIVDEKHKRVTRRCKTEIASFAESSIHFAAHKFEIEAARIHSATVVDEPFCAQPFDSLIATAVVNDNDLGQAL